MKLCVMSLVGVWMVLLLTVSSQAEIKTIVERSGSASATADFTFQNVPAPSQSDATAAGCTQEASREYGC